MDSMLSATRDMDAAKRFFRSTQSIVNAAATQVTTDVHDSYPREIRETLGRKVKHRCSAYLNRRIERDHRGIKQRTILCWGLALCHRLSDSVGHSRKFGSISAPAANRKKSSHSPTPDDSFYPEHSNWKHSSSQLNQVHRHFKPKADSFIQWPLSSDRIDEAPARQKNLLLFVIENHHPLSPL